MSTLLALTLTLFAQANAQDPKGPPRTG